MSRTDAIRHILGTGSIDLDHGLLIEDPLRYDTTGPPDPACLCVRSTSRQRKRWLAQTDRLVALAKGLGSLVLDLLVVCVAVADSGDVVAFLSKLMECPLTGSILQRVLDALRSRTVPPAVAGSHTEACSCC